MLKILSNPNHSVIADWISYSFGGAGGGIRPKKSASKKALYRSSSVLLQMCRAGIRAGAC